MIVREYINQRYVMRQSYIRRVHWQ